MATMGYIDLPVEGEAGGVTTLNGLSGALTLVPGSNITITPSGSNITIASTGGGGSGTVTSVGLSDNSTIPIYTIGSSPITTSGTLTLTLNTEPANEVFAGPVSGSAAQPTFRSLVSADVPILNQNTTGTAANITATTNSTLTTLSSLSLPASQLTGLAAAIAGDTVANISATSNSTLTTLPSLSLPTTQLSGQVSLTTQVSGILPIANGGSSLSTIPNNGQLLIGNGSGYTLSTLSAGSNVSIVNASGSITINSSNPGGTVTSVGLSTPGILYSASGSPVTTSGVLALNLIQQTANTILAGPASGSSANPSFRSLVSADIPNNAANTTGTSSNVTGIVALSHGGTGLSTIGAANTTLISNGTSLSYTATPSPYIVSTISSNTASVSGTTYLSNSSGGSFTITLPTPASGAFIAVKDSTGSFQSNPVTIAPNASEMIEGLASSKLLYTNWGAWSFFSDGTNWFMGPF